MCDVPVHKLQVSKVMQIAWRMSNALDALQGHRVCASMAPRQTRTSAATSSASMGTASDGTDMGKMLEKSFINSTPARLAAVVAAIALSGAGTSLLQGTGLAIAHVMASGVWLGINVWTTFFAGAPPLWPALPLCCLAAWWGCAALRAYV